jgi:hypothetical protein
MHKVMLTTLAVAFGMAATIAWSQTPPASAPEIYKLNKTAKAGKELSVGWYFRIKDNCEFKALPEIDLNIAPKGGTVCIRSDMVPVRNIWSGWNQHCIGTMVRGVRIIYFPFGNFTGLDSMQFRAMTRTYDAKISVEAGDEATAVPASSTPSEPQTAGPMPVCPALVS